MKVVGTGPMYLQTDNRPQQFVKSLLIKRRMRSRTLYYFIRLILQSSTFPKQHDYTYGTHEYSEKKREVVGIS